MLNAKTTIRLHDDTIEAWHRDPLYLPRLQIGPPLSDFAELLLRQHRANFDLWHEEDKARDPSATDAEITRVKHAIDHLNQQRNDLAEQMDAWLIASIPPQNPAAPLHSETPGLIIDRLSILALKIFHTREEANRASATEQHRQRNQARLLLLQEQRADLAGCLDALWGDIQHGERRFKLYRQLKMYNDPDLNPSVYRRAATIRS
jgi:Protein of unknown function (DUF4254)